MQASQRFFQGSYHKEGTLGKQPSLGRREAGGGALDLQAEVLGPGPGGVADEKIGDAGGAAVVAPGPATAGTAMDPVGRDQDFIAQKTQALNKDPLDLFLGGLKKRSLHEGSLDPRRRRKAISRAEAERSGRGSTSPRNSYGLENHLNTRERCTHRPRGAGAGLNDKWREPHDRADVIV